MEAKLAEPSLPAPIPKNPFRPGAGTKPLYLAGRTHEQGEFVQALRQETLSQNLIITGLRGVGKTVLLDELKPLAHANGWLWTGNDWTETASIAEKDVALRLLVDLTAILTPIVTYRMEELPFGFVASKRTAKERPLNYEDLASIYAKTPGFVSDKLKAVLEHVAAILAPTKVKGIVFAYDEAQNLSDHRESDQFPLSVIVDVFSSLQKRQLPCQFLLVLTGLPTLIQKLNEARTYTERMFHILILDRLKEVEARAAVVKPLELVSSTLGFTENTINRILLESKGYPFLIQYICKEVFDAWIGKITVGKAASVPMSEITVKLDQDFFAPRWSRATDRQQAFMQVIATLESSDDEFTIQEITVASRQLLKKPFNPSHATQMLGHLSEKGLIFRNRRGAYCFAVPLLASFIRRQTWDPTTRRPPSASPTVSSQPS
jgi:AAA ATPase domain